MKTLILQFIIGALFASSSFSSFGQCDINAGCTGEPFLSIDPPVFDEATGILTFNNITFGEINCTAPIFTTGVNIYIYQLLPNGDRMELCNFGSIGPDSGFEACDGALLEIEAVLYITEDLIFDPYEESVYSALSPEEFISIDLGTLDININNEFPGGGLPLTTAVINEFTTGSDGPLTVNCGDDVGLYVEGLSRLANCLPYDNISTGIPSELINVFSYTINGGAPIIIPSSADLCDGSTVVVTIATTDVFTGITESDDITIIYSGANCTDCGDMQGCTDNTACNFDATATIDDGSCLFDDCEGTCGGTAVAGTTCSDANGNTGTYTIDCICTICQEEITGTISAADDCDVSGIDITILAPDGTSINITTDTDGSFAVPGGPFPCGLYTAAFTDPGQLPYCYTETGSADPVTFSLDGMDTEENDIEFAADPNIPTLSQWGIIILALLLMSFGAIQLVISSNSFSTSLSKQNR